MELVGWLLKLWASSNSCLLFSTNIIIVLSFSVLLLLLSAIMKINSLCIFVPMKYTSIPLHSEARWWILGLSMLFSGCFIHCSSTCQEASLDECPGRARKVYGKKHTTKKKVSKCSYVHTFTKQLVPICQVASFAQKRWTTIWLHSVVSVEWNYKGSLWKCHSVSHSLQS